MAITDTSTNEAAERLRSKPEQRLIGLIDFQPTDTKIAMRTALAGALRAERRATVERIRAAIDAGEIARDEEDPDDEGDVSYGRVLRILDEVLDAGPYWGNNGGTGAAILDEEAAR